jgi:hypothetical protein
MKSHLLKDRHNYNNNTNTFTSTIRPLRRGITQRFDISPVKGAVEGRARVPPGFINVESYYILRVNTSHHNVNNVSYLV